MKIKITFESFLADKHAEQNPEILDDMLSDHFNDWLGELEVDDVIDWANEYADKIITQVKRDLIK